MEIIEKLENFIKEKNKEAPHMLRTLFWMREIYPEANEEMQIATLCHDIERCFPLRDGEVKPEKTYDDAKDEEYLTWHGKRSAEFAEKVLREFGYSDADKLEKIKRLIAEHSIGGTKERDLMMDADSISFLENNAILFIQRGKDRDMLREKFTSEYERIINPKAKEFAKPFRDRALEELEK